MRPRLVYALTYLLTISVVSLIALAAQGSGAQPEAATPDTPGALVVLDKNGQPKQLACPLRHTDVKAEISGFLARVTEAFQALGPLTEYASEVTVTCYQDNGKEEFQQIFIGPSAEAIHEIRRQCVEEDLAALLSPHFDKARVDKVTNIVNQMFDEEWKSRPAAEEQPVATAALQPHPRNRHLH